MRRRIIVRSKNQCRPVERTHRKKQPISENQKWKNNLGKRGMFQWDIKIIEKCGNLSHQTISTDSYDDAKTWACFKCKEGMTVFIDDQEVIKR